jgi:arabinose-5-phosphate isomerase
MPSLNLVVAECVAAAREAIEIEAEAIALAARKVDEEFVRAVQIILQNKGNKVVVTGVGKSGLVGRKIVSTLRSTGTQAVFMHPVEAAHGDLGIYAPEDPTIFISKSGTTSELSVLIPMLREFRSPLIGILGNTSSPLAGEMDVVLDASVRHEADPHDMAPTASTAVAMAIGDALAIALMRSREFGPDEFAAFHPGGQLGRNMKYSVSDAMHTGGDVAWAAPTDSAKQVIISMSQHPLGAACVIGSDGRLSGIVTDGDLRRALERNDDIRNLTAAEIMTPHPIVTSPDATLRDALKLMEDRPSQISVLPVVDPADARCLGVIRLHDIYQAGLPPRVSGRD